MTPDYSPSRFYTASGDAKGHGSFVSVRMPPDIGSWIAETVASKRIPAYRTSQDFIRDAIVHRLHWLADHELDPDDARRVREIAAIHLIDTLLNDDDFVNMKAEEQLERLVSKANALAAEGAYKRLLTWARDLRPIAQQLPENYARWLGDAIDHWQKLAMEGLQKDVA